MTKHFLITVEAPDGVPQSQPDDYLRHELEQFAAALFEYHSGGHAQPAVKCLLVNPHPWATHER